MIQMPNAAVMAEAVWVGALVIYLVIRIPHRRRAHKEPVLTSKRSVFDWLVRTFAVICYGILPGTYVAAKLPHMANYPFYAPMALIGAAILLAGLWCIYRSLTDLGRSFSPSMEIRHSHQLVTSGIYQYIRHPMYLGYLLWAVAQAMLLPNWIVGPAALISWTLLFGSRVRREEGMMLDQFGDQYRAYMTRTARLVPGVF